jgi:serine/threonine-protein kinase
MHLGRGAMGDVYRANHVKVPRTFAVKVLLPELVKDPKVVARFEREAELAGRLRHRNVTSVIDVGETDGTRYLVMDFAEGQDLGALMNAQPVEPARAMMLFRQLLEGLEHAHAHDVVHRDLKPENVIVEVAGDDEIARIVDFGVAILRDGAAGGGDRLTTGGLVIGTPHYMAPELATGKAFDHRVDLFALGVILYEMLTGVMPYEGSGVDVAMANIKIATPPMSLRAPHVTVDPLHEALTRALMEKKPEARPQSARETKALLDLIATDREAAAGVLGIELAPRTPAPSTIPPLAYTAPTVVEPPPRDTASTRELLALSNRRSRWIAWAAMAALLIAVTATGVALLGRREATAEVTLDLGSSAPTTTPARNTATESMPPFAIVTPVLVPLATPVKAPPVERPPPLEVAPQVMPKHVETSPDDPRTVVDLYQQVARALKSIADRRDMAADDLWVRYRRIRIQDALGSSGKRADAMNELAQIDQEIERRFGKPR